MSRIGKKPIVIPKGVKIDPQPGVVEVQGPKGKLRQPLPAGIGFEVPAGIDIAIDKQTHITVTGIDRQAVGQVAANIRRLRKPDPYKQKGVRYTGEVLKKKAGKTGAK